ncbi:ABC-2 transporter permease [Oceanobacillus neutriphilus]|uniref:Permease n=1 Tax=Oceanobacillus neutriphilus TaxID=531815 RepID=A0ABQ2NXK9_9BACI|nr:ABC-2 transporter permease [Oceanobacillus neutriphilus]GGP13037.1 permease [Oceanobacillus neutriphilus]
MANLIRRDLIIQKYQLYLFIPFILFFIFAGSHMSAFFIFVFAGFFIPINAYSYDEKVETNILLNSLPYTRTQIIASRYIGAIFYMAVSIVITTALFYVFNRPFTWADIAIGAGITLTLFSFSFPLFYLLKPGNIGTAVTIGFILFVVLSGPTVMFFEEYLTPVVDFLMNVSSFAIYLSGAGIITALYAISWIISQIIYQRKTF